MGDNIMETLILIRIATEAVQALGRVLAIQSAGRDPTPEEQAALRAETEELIGRWRELAPK